jgi:hypothetical protein
MMVIQVTPLKEKDTFTMAERSVGDLEIDVYVMKDKESRVLAVTLSDEKLEEIKSAHPEWKTIYRHKLDTYDLGVIYDVNGEAYAGQ